MIDCLAEAHRLLYRAKVGLDHAREILRGNDQLVPQVNELLSFIQIAAGRQARPGPRTQESRVKTLKLAVVGAGHLGRIHARLLAEMADVELVGVVDPVAAGRAKRGRRLPAPRPVPTTASCSAASTRAVVATPTRFHHAVALDFLRHGMPLLVEKPLAANLAEADELVAAAARHGVRAASRPHRTIQSGLRGRRGRTVGEPKYIEAVRASGFTVRSTDIGVVLDLMIHDIDLAAVAGRLRRWRSVSALGLAILGRHEDVAQARLEFENGCVANLSASRVSYHSAPKRQMQVWSARMASRPSISAIARPASSRPAAAVLERQFDYERVAGRREGRPSRTGCSATSCRSSRWSSKTRNALADELRDFVEAVRTARAPRVTGQQGRDAVAVAERILSAMRAQPRPVASPEPASAWSAPAPPTLLRGPHWTAPQPTAPRREAG